MPFACAVLLTKDEYNMIDDCIEFYARALGGAEHVYVIDNGSTHPDVADCYRRHRERGGTVVVDDRSFRTATAFMSGHMRTLTGRYSISSGVRLVDFGCSHILNATDERMSTITGTPRYMAPEVKKRSYTMKADIWSLGVTLFWMYTMTFPDRYDGLSDSRLGDASISFLDFMACCMSVDVEKRPCAYEASQHGWITKKRSFYVGYH
jgi:hypothetical protein